MSQLETAVIPILEPMILGHKRSLSVEERRILATWAIKTSLTLNEYGRDDPVPLPPQLYLDLQAHRTPPGDHKVFVAAVADEPGLVGWDAAGAFLKNNEMFGYVSFLLLRGVVFQVIGAERDVAALDRDFYEQLWPAENTLRWPPARTIPRPLANDEAPPLGTQGYPTAWPRPIDAAPFIDAELIDDGLV
jgi:hypothetical protein